ncbi:MAG: hypothetical protein GY711_26970 [bacterium]|nr:hypothetical protein [bacterium]
MNRISLVLLPASLLCARSDAQSTLWSQSVDNTTIVAGSASCLNNPAGIVDNSYWRLYDPVACGVATDYEVEAVRFGIENSNTTSGSQLVRINLHSDPTPGAPGPLSDLSLLGRSTQGGPVRLGRPHVEGENDGRGAGPLGGGARPRAGLDRRSRALGAGRGGRRAGHGSP